MLKHLRYFIEALIVYLLFAIFWLLPLDIASNIGGFLGRLIGPHTNLSQRAIKNISQALPHLSEAEHHKIKLEMWDNLGRLFAEYPHLKQIGKERTEFVNLEILEKYRKKETPLVLISAHVGNWEIHASSLYNQVNLPITLTYRPPNNPWVDSLLLKARCLGGKVHALPKETESGRKMLQILKKKGVVGILIDQKYNEGILAPFFHQDAKTNPIFASLAQKYDAPIISFYAERIKGAHFKIHIDDSIKTQNSSKENLEIIDIVTTTNKLLEKSILKNPAQWIWVHRRWS